MGRASWGPLAGLLLVSCVTPYGERVGAQGPMAPTEPAPMEATTPAETTEAEPAPPPEEEAPKPESKPEEPAKPEGIDVEWTYFAGKVADEQLGPLGGPEVEEQVGPWKCKISKQETTTEGSHPVARERTISCKHWGDTTVGAAVTCDLDRTANDVTLSLGTDEVVVACEAK